MWTPANRGRYDRSGLRYPSDLTDAEWAVIAPLIPPGKRGGAAVCLSAGLERGGGANDEHEMNAEPGTPRCFSNP